MHQLRLSPSAYTHIEEGQVSLVVSGLTRVFEGLLRDCKSAEKERAALCSIGLGGEQRFGVPEPKRKAELVVCVPDVAVEGGGGARVRGGTCLLRDQPQARWKVGVRLRERGPLRGIFSSFPCLCFSEVFGRGRPYGRARERDEMHGIRLELRLPNV